MKDECSLFVDGVIGAAYFRLFLIWRTKVSCGPTPQVEAL